MRKAKTTAERLAVLESQVRSLQVAAPRGVSLLQRIDELEERTTELEAQVAELRESSARRVGREHATPYLCANQVGTQTGSKE